MLTIKTRALTSVIGLCCALGMAGHASAQSVKWDMASVLPSSNFQLQNAERFAEEVEKVTDGEVKITVHSGGALGYKGPELLSTVADGLVQMADIQMNQQVGEDPFFSIESLPFIAAGYDDLKQLQKLTRPVFEDIAERFNQKILYVTPWPPQAFFSPNAIEDDISGFADQSVRTIDKNATDFFSALDAKPVQMPWGEVMPSLASGVLDAVSTAATSAVDGKFWEFVPYHNRLQWQMNSQMVTVNLDAWNQLSDEHQQAIDDLANELEEEFWDSSVEADKRSVETLEEHGMKTITPSAELQEELRQVGESLWKDYAESVGPRAEEVLSKYLESSSESE